MQAYTSTAHVNNPFVPPPIPTLRWTYDQRAAASMRQTRTRVKHAGRARRHRREIDVRRGLDHQRELLAGRVTFEDRDRRRYTVRQLIAADLRGAPGWARVTQDHARRALGAIAEHGPASGWAVAQPIAGMETNPKWTPYVVPKAGEKCWRWWRSLRLMLARLLPRLARAVGEVVPLHRLASSRSTREERQDSGSVSEQREETGYRDHSIEALGVVLRRVQLRFGM